MLKHLNAMNRKAAVKGLIAAALTVVLVFAGSRNLQNFDPALIGYLAGTIFAVFGVTYRYNVWIQRPATQLYWKRSLQFLFSKAFVRHSLLAVQLVFKNILMQKFILARGTSRWIGHMLFAFGCIMGFAITLPLTFGWIHFEFKSGDTLNYYAHLFGFEVGSFELGSIMAFMAFHGLVFAAIMVTVGVIMIVRRRLTDGGLIATQTFEFDWIPVFLLLAIALTGIGIAFDYTYLQGRTYQFMAVFHALTVVLFLLYLPFGKFFHIFQRLAQLGAILYRTEGQKRGMAVCPHTQEAFTSQLHIDDLKKVTEEMGFNFSLEDGRSYLDWSPEGKRSNFAKAHMKAREEAGSGFFG